MNSVTAYTLTAYQPYMKLLNLQSALHALRVAERIGDSILLLEHTPVISIGRSRGAESHLLADPVALRQQGIEVCVTNRGGDITYHGPGQLVVYFIMALHERDIRRFISQIEHSVIRFLDRYEIQGARKAGFPGVWVGEEKICAVGIYVRKWVTMHGVALNVSTNLAHFDFIVPCGIHHKGVTSLQKIQQERRREGPLDMQMIQHEYMTCFAETFQVAMQEGDPRRLWQFQQDHAVPLTQQHTSA